MKSKKIEKNLELLRKIGTAIKVAREDKNLTQEELAYEADLDRTYISGIEKGERNISVTTLYKLTKTLKIEINIPQLLNGKSK